MYFMSVLPSVSRTGTPGSTLRRQIFLPRMPHFHPGPCAGIHAGPELLATCFLRRLLHLIRADIANMCGDRPLMAKRVFEFAVTIAPEHVLEWHRYLRPRSRGVRDERVDVLDIEVNCDR